MDDIIIHNYSPSRARYQGRHIFGDDRTLDGQLDKKPAMTYSRPGRTTIGPECLTAVFGMGTGVATRVWSPAVRVDASSDASVYGGSFGQFGGHELQCYCSDRSLRSGQSGQAIGC